MVFTACLDTCVLVPSLLRDVLLEIAKWNAYRPIWSSTSEIELDETIREIQGRRGVHQTESEAYIRRLVQQMNSSFPGARVDLSENRIDIDPTHLVDPDDAHVIEAAILGQAAVIVTFNLKDFPEALLPNDLFTQTPDDFLMDLLDLKEALTLQAVSTVSRRTGRKGPHRTEEEILLHLGKSGLKQFAKTAHGLIR